ncbi:MAG: hypothetical protein ACKO23_19795 [Gemmataceae bacterium]
MAVDIFADLEATFRDKGSREAIDHLCNHLRSTGDYQALFYALLVKGRHDLGVSPMPTGSAEELPASVHEPYEEVIRNAAREVGGLFLAANNLPQAWPYFRMIGEKEPIFSALEAANPAEDDDIQPLIQVAFYEEVHPGKGFEWILGRYGLCSAITTLSSGELPHGEAMRQECIRKLVRALYAELHGRLLADIEHRDGPVRAESRLDPSQPGALTRLLEGRDHLFTEETYHIDLSHLSSVVQMSMLLPHCPELEMARELCLYGSKLTGRFMGRPDDPPFDQGYRDYGVYLAILAGDKVDEGLAHFHRKAREADPEEIGTYPAEVLINLLIKLGRNQEALEAAEEFLSREDLQGRQFSCPGLQELCQKHRDFPRLVRLSRKWRDPVHFLAGLVAGQEPKKP